MFMQPTIEKLYAMKLNGMADLLRQQIDDPTTSQLSFEERFSLLVDHHWTWRENKALSRRLRNAKLRSDACLEDIDWRHPRGLVRKASGQHRAAAAGPRRCARDALAVDRADHR